MESADVAGTIGLEIGKRYKVKLWDCCVKGELEVGKFLHYLVLRDESYVIEYEKPEPEDDEDVYWDAIFEAGKLGPDWGKWTPIPMD